MSHYYDQHPAPAPAPPPPQQQQQQQQPPQGYPYYQQPPPPAGYNYPPPPPQNGYPSPPTNPTPRAHTAAPGYGQNSHFAPPPPAAPPYGYPQNGSQQPQAQSPASSSGALPASMPAEQIDNMLALLQQMKMAGGGGGNNGPPDGAPPTPSSIPNTMMPPPVPQHSQRAYPYPSAPGREPPQLHMPVMPGAYDPGPPPPPGSRSKTPTARSEGRPEMPRKQSEVSDVSYASEQSTMSRKKSYAERWEGVLVDEGDKKIGPQPSRRLKIFLQAIANYIIRFQEPMESLVITADKMVKFYGTFALSDELIDWQGFFNTRSPQKLSQLLCEMFVQHHLVPGHDYPSTPLLPYRPGITPLGFEAWMFTMIMVDPDREYRRLSKILDEWALLDPTTNDYFPRRLPRECLPKHGDDKIRDAFWGYKGEFGSDMYSSDEEDLDAPMKALPPAPGGGTRPRPPSRHSSGFPLRGGERNEDLSDEEHFQPPQLTRKRTSQPYHSTNVAPDPMQFLTAEEEKLAHTHASPPPPVDTSSPIERPRQPYAARPVHGAVEDLNPRPILGQADAMHRSKTITSHGPPPHPRPGESAAKAPSQTSSSRRERHRKRAQSTHRARSRARGSSPERDYDERDFEEPRAAGERGRVRAAQRFPQGYKGRWEGDGLYEPRSPVLRSTTPAAPVPAPPPPTTTHAHGTEYIARPVSRGAPTGGHGVREKEIPLYQEREFEYPAHGAHVRHGSRRIGSGAPERRTWVYGHGAP